MVVRGTTHPPDGGYGWVLVIASFFLQFLTNGMSFSTGLFFEDFLQHFHSVPERIAWIFSINACFLGGSGFLATIFINLFGVRPVIMAGAVVASLSLLASAYVTKVSEMYITFGLMTGVAQCMIFTPALVIVGQYFEKRRALAMTMCNTGPGFGMLIFSPLIGYIKGNYPWRYAFTFLAAITLHTLPLGAVMRPLPIVENTVEEKLAIIEENSQVRSRAAKVLQETRKLLDITLFTHVKFCLLVLNCLLYNMGPFVVFMLLNGYVEARGHGTMAGANMLSAIGFASTVGPILMVIVIGTTNADVTYLYTFMNINNGIAMILFTASGNFYFMFACSVYFGFTFGSQMCLLAVVGADLMGRERLASAIGLLMVAHGLGYLTGPPFAGWLMGPEENYGKAFAASGVIILTAAFFMCIICAMKCFKKMSKRRIAIPQSDSPS